LEDSPELYRRISPSYHAKNITTPLLLIVGQKDTRFNNTLLFHEALRKAGTPVTFVVYPTEATRSRI
jgi:dipeptidyl aminopeptidase/acylaminoacyl peptidase